MKFQYTALALAACLGTVVAQGMDGLPDCAKTCASDSIPEHCKLIDVGCICGDKSFITNISCCVAKSCSSDKQAAAIQFANQICKGGGVTDLPQSASCANGESTATGKSSASSGTSTGSDSTKSGTGATATTTGASATQGTATASPTAGSTGSSTSANPAATTTAGAAHIQTKDTGVLAAVGAALFAFLV